MLIKIRNVVIVIVSAVVIFFAAFKLGDIDVAADFAKKETVTDNAASGSTDTAQAEEDADGTEVAGAEADIEAGTDDEAAAHKHVYESATGNTCTVCGMVYEPVIKEISGTYSVVTANCAVRSNYYQGDNIVKRLNVDDEVKVVGILTNALEHDWYITEEGYYIYDGNLVKVSEE